MIYLINATKHLAGLVYSRNDAEAEAWLRLGIECNASLVLPLTLHFLGMLFLSLPAFLDARK